MKLCNPDTVRNGCDCKEEWFEPVLWQCAPCSNICFKVPSDDCIKFCPAFVFDAAPECPTTVTSNAVRTVEAMEPKHTAITPPVMALIAVILFVAGFACGGVYVCTGMYYPCRRKKNGAMQGGCPEQGRSQPSAFVGPRDSSTRARFSSGNSQSEPARLNLIEALQSQGDLSAGHSMLITLATRSGNEALSTRDDRGVDSERGSGSESESQEAEASTLFTDRDDFSGNLGEIEGAMNQMERSTRTRSTDSKRSETLPKVIVNQAIC